MIYFVQAGKNGAIKIGYTENNIDDRLKILQIGSPVRLFVLGTVEGTRKDEYAFHKKFHPYQIHGEWFRPDRILIDFIRGVCNNELIGILDSLEIFQTKSLDEVIEEIEKDYIVRALEYTRGRKQRAADLLGISFRTFRYRIQKYNMML